LASWRQQPTSLCGLAKASDIGERPLHQLAFAQVVDDFNHPPIPCIGQTIVVANLACRARDGCPVKLGVSLSSAFRLFLLQLPA